MTYRATLRLAAEQLLRLADDTDPQRVFVELGHLLNNRDGGSLREYMKRARGEAAEVLAVQAGSQVAAAELVGLSGPTFSRQMGRAHG